MDKDENHSPIKVIKSLIVELRRLRPLYTLKLLSLSLSVIKGQITEIFKAI